MKNRLTRETAVAALAATGEDYAELFGHGSLEVGFYRPVGMDPQEPHTKDEVYVVMSGSGYFVSGPDRKPFVAGEALFVAAGVAHRFEQFTEDFCAWVVFYGPEGGER